MTDLHDAVKSGDLNKCKELIQHGADVNAKKYDETPLHEAAYCGHLNICELLIKHGADVNGKSLSGWTPLHQAADEGYLEICELLIKNDADVNAKDDEGKTPLHEAIHKEEEYWDKEEGSEMRDFVLEKIKICKLLIRHGADVKAKDQCGKTPSDYAIECGYPTHIIDFLP